MKNVHISTQVPSSDIYNRLSKQRGMFSYLHYHHPLSITITSKPPITLITNKESIIILRNEAPLVLTWA